MKTRNKTILRPKNLLASKIPAIKLKAEIANESKKIISNLPLCTVKLNQHKIIFLSTKAQKFHLLFDTYLASKKQRK